MSQPIQPQPQPTQRPPMPPLPPQPPFQAPAKRKRFGWLALILTGVICLGIGGAVGGSGTDTTAQPAPTATATETVTAYPSSPQDDGSTTEPTTEPTKAPAAWNPKPKDFKVNIKVTKKECFGTAGCNLSYKVSLDYLGSQKIPDAGTTDITYKISGAEQEILGTLTLNSEGKFDSSEESTGTKSSSSKLVAKVTTVDYNEFG